MSFTHVRGEGFNTDLFTNKEELTENKEITSTPTEQVQVSSRRTYTEQDLLDLKEHCSAIVEMGEDASPQELRSLDVAVNEINSLEKKQITQGDEVVNIYIQGENTPSQ